MTNKKLCSYVDRVHADGEHHCEAEGTHCVHCACYITCVHSENPVCAYHEAWIDGYMTSRYDDWEEREPENYDEESWALMYIVIDMFFKPRT